jgi:hypothetical protein
MPSAETLQAMSPQLNADVSLYITDEGGKKIFQCGTPVSLKEQH